jgi:hypothetical protein
LELDHVVSDYEDLFLIDPMDEEESAKRALEKVEALRFGDFMPSMLSSNNDSA